MLKYDWEITGDLDVNEAMKTIFHPTLYQFYLKDNIKDLNKLRIKIEKTKHGGVIRFYEIEETYQ